MSQDFESFEDELEVEQPLESGVLEEAAVDGPGEVSTEASADAPADALPAEAGAPVVTSFGTVTDRLSEIAEVMEDETMPLDDALDLLEEAVALGMQASSLLESDMDARNAEAEEEMETDYQESAE